IRFNGRGFTRDELADPYGFLFDEAAPTLPRNQQFVYALLATLRKIERPFTMKSGIRRTRYRLTMKTLMVEEAGRDQANLLSKSDFYDSVGLKFHVQQLSKGSGTHTIVDLNWRMSTPLPQSGDAGLTRVPSSDDAGEQDDWETSKYRKGDLELLTEAAA